MPVDHRLRIAVSACVIAAVVLVPAAPGFAAPAARTFANCSEVRAVYSGGIAKAGVQWNLVNGRKRPLVGKVKFSTALYEANRGSDRDRDGIACEAS